jgi:hypothetical protein
MLKASLGQAPSVISLRAEDENPSDFPTTSLTLNHQYFFSSHGSFEDASKT